MEIEIDVFGSKEIDIHPQERKRRKHADNYDYTDPFIEQFEGEDDAVEVEPHIDNFFMYEGPLQERPSKVLSAHVCASKKTNNKKETSAKPSDVVHCMQNLIYSKILDNVCVESDVLDFLLYDLIINHDTMFERAKEKLKPLDSVRLLSTEFMRLGMDELHTSAGSWYEKVSSILSKDDIYEGNNIIFTNELCDAVFHYIDAKIKVDTYSMEVISNKKINYNNARKNAYIQVYSCLREGTKNYRQLGYYVYKYTRKQKIGRYNGFKPEYLSIERENESKFERTFDTFSSAGETKRSHEFKEEYARGCGEEDLLCSREVKSHENTGKYSGVLQNGKTLEPAECTAKNEIISNNNSWSLQKVESQWLDTMPDVAKNDDSGSKASE